MNMASVICIGVVAGFLEVILLSKFIQGIIAGNLFRSILLLMGKLVVLAVSFIIVILLDPQKLWISGLSVVVVLLVGSAVLALKRTRGKKGGIT